MNNINLSQVSYVDYVASLYFNAMNVKEVSFTPKTVEANGEKVVLIHIEGVQTSTGVKVNVDLWPRDNATADDLANLPTAISDIEFRIGFWPAIDENGEQTLRQGTPKWTLLKSGDKKILLSGGKREFNA